MKDWQPKVGDIVVRDPEYWQHSDVDLMEKCTVIEVRNGVIRLDDMFDRLYEYWMPDKNAIVINILNDL